MNSLPETQLTAVSFSLASENLQHPHTLKTGLSFKPERRAEISCALECKKQARRYLIILGVEVVDQQVDSTGGDHGVGDAGAGVGQTGQQTAGQHQHLVVR